MKKIVIRVVLALVCLGVLALVILFFSLNGIVKKGVETVGPRLTGVEVTLGAAEISPFSGSGKLTKIFVGNPEGYKTPSAIAVGSAQVVVKVGSVLSDVIVIDEINVQEPEITLEGSFSGNNLTKILSNVEGANNGQPPPKPANAPAEPATPKKQKKFIVKDFVINGGKINLSLNLPVLGGHSATAPLPPIHLTNIGVAEGGVTASELVLTIGKPLVTAVLKAAEAEVGSLGKGAQDLIKPQNVQQGIQKGLNGIGDLFKK